MSENEIDLDAISGNQLAEMVKSSNDEQLRDTIRLVGIDQALTRIFGEMQDRFKPGAAGGTDANVVFAIADADNVYPYHVKIDGGTCTTGAGELDDPRVRLQMQLPVFLKLITNNLSGPMAFMSGKLKIEGDMMLASRLMGFFEAPSA
jgi:putative sterol carrier protein